MLVGGSDGNVWMWRIPSGESKLFQGDDSRNTCASFTSDGELRGTSDNMVLRFAYGHLQSVC